MAKEITQGMVFGFVAVVIVAFLGSRVGVGCSHYEPSGASEEGATTEAPAAAAEAEAEQQAETSEDEEGQTAE